MIKIFRQIRKDLMESGKTTKYFKYAIGEIILVVIGILMALQINNWNEQRKERIFEVKMLKEIRYDLIKDTIYFNALINLRITPIATAIDTINELLENREVENDSFLKYVNTIKLGYRFIYHKGAYEALKSVGLDKVSNDSIRLELTSLYGFHLPRVEVLTAHRRSLTDKISERVFHKIFKYQIVKTSQGNKPKLQAQDSLLFQNSDFIEFVIATKDEVSDSKARLYSTLKKCSELLALLDKELEIINPLLDIPDDKYSN